jgi:hypothetical protein
VFRKIALLGCFGLSILAATWLNQGFAQFTDYNDHDPGVTSAAIPNPSLD